MRTLAQRLASQVDTLHRLATVKDIENVERKKAQAIRIIEWLSEQHLKGMVLDLSNSSSSELVVKHADKYAPLFVVTPTFLDAGVSTVETWPKGYSAGPDTADRDAVHEAMRTMVADTIPLAIVDHLA